MNLDKNVYSFTFSNKNLKKARYARVFPVCTLMYPCATGMLLVCTRMYLYVTRMLITCMYLYVTRMYSYVLVLCFSHDPFC